MARGAERRAAVRRGISLEAQLEDARGRARACLVRDYCSGGLLVRLGMAADAASIFAVGDVIKVAVTLLSSSSSKGLRIPARIAWLRDDFMGLAFVRPSESLAKGFAKHDAVSTGRGEGGGELPVGGETRNLARLRNVARGMLPDLLRDLLRSVNDDLLAASYNAASIVEQHQVFGDMTSLEAMHETGELIDAVFDDSAALLQVGGGAKLTEPAALELVKPDDFERWLEASRAATLLERRHSERLAGLAVRLGSQAGEGFADAPSVPFNPRQITQALAKVAERAELGGLSRQVMFDRATLLLGERLADLYAAFDRALDNQGVPAAEVAWRGAPVRQVAGADAGSLQQRGTVAQEDWRPSEESAGAPTSPVDAELLASLRVTGTRWQQSLAHELLDGIREETGMSADRSGWMAQLSEPLLHEAARDPSFFQDAGNPLRAILDTLEYLQIFAAPADAKPADDPIYRRVDELLRPLRSGRADRQAIDALAGALREIGADQGRRYQRRVERIVEASEGRDRVRRARIAVAAELNRRYAGQSVSPLLPELIEVGWRAVLELAWLNSAEDADAYRTHLDVLDRLLGLLELQPYAEGSGPADAQSLLLQIERGLASAAFDPYRRGQFETRLRRELFDVSVRRGPVVMASLDEPTTEADLSEPPAGIAERGWDRARAQAATLAVGDHLHLLDEAEGRRDLRIAWIRSDRGAFTLVDQRGLQVCDLSELELVLRLHQRRIRVEIFDARPLSERVLDKMLHGMQQRLSSQVEHDSLTGLMDRRRFQVALERSLSGSSGSRTGMLFLLDLDQFRLVNEVHGYDTGDRLLIAVARLIERQGHGGVVGYLGADRFALLFPKFDRADGEDEAVALCAAVRTMPFDWRGGAIGLSCSVGMVDLAEVEAGSLGAMHAAEEALLLAKEGGGDRVLLYSAQDPSIARRQASAQWAVQVDEALEHGRLHLRCQPIVPLRPGQGMHPHYEILLGVTSGGGQPLPIMEFIEAAERYNRMRSVDRWVTQTVIEQIAANRDLMPGLHCMAVNLSGQTASDPAFVDFVRLQIQRMDIDPAWLSFEITETAAVSDLSHTAGIVGALKHLGCKVALDDFGSGLASYAYLKALPVDWLKIDGVFVKKIAGDREDYGVVKSINEIGHFLGKQTIAEYVADAEILRLVTQIGVDFVQGYEISPPLLLEEVLKRQRESGLDWLRALSR